MKRPLIEACVDSYASAMAASRAGADRLELCAHLVIGGTTPTHALFRQVQRDSGVPINVLIRPRFGDFLYTEPELEEMCEEIAAFRDLGANGVVIGALTPDGELDLAQMRRMMACAGQMEVTLHRAFDMTRDPFRALPGMEQQFFEAAQSVRSYDLVLNLLEREVKREARKRAGRTAQSAAAFLITAGLIILATLGFAAALLLMHCPIPAVSVTAFMGVAVSLGWAVIRK